MYPSDAYALCMVCSLCKELTPKYAFVFADEAQDISKQYDLLMRINCKASLDDRRSRAERHAWRGVDWRAAFPDFGCSPSIKITATQIRSSISSRPR
ncbi:MAG: hypothetical protein ACLRSW_11010 [Christensenellaceae bacterium]